jgi:hypothetical protein
MLFLSSGNSTSTSAPAPYLSLLTGLTSLARSNKLWLAQKILKKVVIQYKVRRSRILRDSAAAIRVYPGFRESACRVLPVQIIVLGLALRGLRHAMVRSVRQLSNWPIIIIIDQCSYN